MESNFFNYMMHGGGYERMVHNEAEFKRRFKQCKEDLSLKSHACSKCGEIRTEVKGHGDSGGCSCWCQCSNCGNESSHVFFDANTANGVMEAYKMWNTEN